MKIIKVVAYLIFGLSTVDVVTGDRMRRDREWNMVVCEDSLLFLFYFSAKQGRNRTENSILVERHGFEFRFLCVQNSKKIYAGNSEFTFAIEISTT